MPRNVSPTFSVIEYEVPPKHICDPVTSSYQVGYRTAPWRHHSGSSSHSERRGDYL